MTETLNPPQPASAIAKIVISMQSHNGFAETDDNWNVDAVTVTLLGGPGGAQKELMNFFGEPLARLTHSSSSLTIPEEPIGPPGTFNTIEFFVKTGGDDLRSNSSVSVTFKSANGNVLQEAALLSRLAGTGLVGERNLRCFHAVAIVCGLRWSFVLSKLVDANSSICCAVSASMGGGWKG